jgi:hypothetical protein
MSTTNVPKIVHHTHNEKNKKEQTDEYTSLEWQPSKPSKIQEKLKEKIKIAREIDEMMAFSRDIKYR